MAESHYARMAKFKIGDGVRHRVYPFRGVVYDVDPVFNNTEEWLTSIPEEIRPHKDQPFYHLLAENDRTTYVALAPGRTPPLMSPTPRSRPCCRTRPGSRAATRWCPRCSWARSKAPTG